MEWKRINEQVETKDDNWFVIHDSEEEKSLIHEETDEDYVVGTFLVKNVLSEMGSKIGTITSPHKYAVVIRSDEGMTPHFHVFDKAGMHRSKAKHDGFHTCVEIRQNRYFKHDAYTDDLDKEAMAALDTFMGTIRTKGLNQGKSNFIHTIMEWNANNTEDDETSPNWVDPGTTEKPDYTKIMDNL